MPTLDRRSIPTERLVAALTPASYPEAMRQLLLAAALPSRKRRLFRIRHGSQYLWLKANKTAFNTRASAKLAVITWLDDALLEIASLAETGHPFSTNDWVFLNRRLGLPTDGPFNRSFELIKAQVESWFADGTLALEEVELSREAF